MSKYILEIKAIDPRESNRIVEFLYAVEAMRYKRLKEQQGYKVTVRKEK